MVVHAVVFRPLPYPDPARLVELFEDNRALKQPFFRVSALNYLTWTEQAKSFDSLAAFIGSDFNLFGDDGTERLPGSLITSSMFRVLGVSPLVGRPLQTQDEILGSPRVVIISESLWR